MCLSDFSISKNDLFGNNDSLVLYKVVTLNERKKGRKYRAPYRKFPTFFYKLNSLNISNRKGVQVSPTERDYCKINKGIHVCLTLDKAQMLRDWGYERVILRCVCYKKDYVAHNNREAVFTQIKLLSGEVK